MIAFHDAVPRVARVQVLPSALTSTHARPTSSDAVPDTFRGPGATRAPGPGETIAMVGLVVSGPELDPFGVAEIGGLRGPRSEERRVGKECRARWAACSEK